MSSERKDTLKKRLDENYTAFIESLQRKTVSEFITAGQYDVLILKQAWKSINIAFPYIAF